MIVFDEVANMTPEQEKRLEKIIRLATMYGSNWVTPKACALCKQIHETHPFLQCYYNHPFFNNNLEYLEWEYERKHNTISE